MRVIGLTGIIGAGKTSVLQMFANDGVVTFSADMSVHDIYNKEAKEAIAAEMPEAIVDGSVDRSRLGQMVAFDNAALQKLEQIIHPLVRARIKKLLLATKAQAWHRQVVIDIPLLFENGWQNFFDAIITVTATERQCYERVMQRPGMTEQKYNWLRSHQLDQKSKAHYSHFVIDNSGNLEYTSKQVEDIRSCLAAGYC